VQQLSPPADEAGSRVAAEQQVQPAGEGGGEEGGIHPGAVDALVAGGQMPQRGAVFGLLEALSDVGAVAVPVLEGGGMRRGWRWAGRSG
jgi:hypothetical protein